VTDAEKDAWINEVWNLYQERSGRERLMSSVEFSLARWWREQGYPLRVVCGAIERAPKVGRNLMYLENVVGSEVERWQRGQTV
jgi:hypothetical protein